MQFDDFRKVSDAIAKKLKCRLDAYPKEEREEMVQVCCGFEEKNGKKYIRYSW